MKIVDVSQPIICFVVETEDASYTRYSEDCWFERMGESDEPVYDCTELEELFQDYIC